MRSPSAAAPPLWVWLASVLLAAAVLAATLPAFLAVESEAQMARPPTWLYDAIGRFAANADRAHSSLRVIAFGDSALGTATLQGPEMTAYARERGLDLDFLQLWLPFCLLHQILPAMDAALAAKPQVLMIQTWSLMYRIDPHVAEIHRAFQAERGSEIAAGLQRIAERPSLVLDHQAYLLDLLTGATGEVAHGGLPETRQVGVARGHRGGGGRLVCNAQSRARMVRLVEQRLARDGASEIDPLLRQTIDVLLARAAAQGVRVVFFDIPHAQPVESLPSMVQKRALTLQLLHEYANDPRAEFWQFPEPIDDDDTCDYVHFSEAGRNRYLPWFVDELSALLRGDPR